MTSYLGHFFAGPGLKATWASQAHRCRKYRDDQAPSIFQLALRRIITGNDRDAVLGDRARYPIF